MADPLINHKVEIHVTAAPDTVLADANKLEGGSTFSVTETVEFEEQKFLNSEGYTENTPVWASLSGGSIAGTRLAGSVTQETIETARKAQTPIYIHVILDPTATAGSQGWRYKAYVESDEKAFEAGSLLKFNWPLKFSGAPVAI